MSREALVRSTVQRNGGNWQKKNSTQVWWLMMSQSGFWWGNQSELNCLNPYQWIPVQRDPQRPFLFWSLRFSLMFSEVPNNGVLSQNTVFTQNHGDHRQYQKEAKRRHNKWPGNTCSVIPSNFFGCHRDFRSSGGKSNNCPSRIFFARNPKNQQQKILYTILPYHCLLETWIPNTTACFIMWSSFFRASETADQKKVFDKKGILETKHFLFAPARVKLIMIKK